ncbi:hypothetical protein CYY_003391 [Polysphondylium violaceum]|uniref:Ankyrin repeat-containing protein n=1 Tax=Polysphondylium violaceum TaxID=133409 RepID=A0A8J4V8Q9_9MYCE|nr:hypothetical protein CYY_003391 [Polysphondylium violaceum]
MDILYRQVFNNQYLSMIVYEIIHSYNGQRYRDITRLDWMIKYKHFGLLKDKVKRSDDFVSYPQRYLIFSLLEKELFELVFNHFRDPFYPLDDERLVVLNDAAQFNNYNAVQFLYEMGYKGTHLALQHAAKHGNMDMLVFLYETARVGPLDYDALHNAVEAKNEKLVEYILNNSTDLVPCRYKLPNSMAKCMVHGEIGIYQLLKNHFNQPFEKNLVHYQMFQNVKSFNYLYENYKPVLLRELETSKAQIYQHFLYTYQMDVQVFQEMKRLGVLPKDMALQFMRQAIIIGHLQVYKELCDYVNNDATGLDTLSFTEIRDISVIPLDIITELHDKGVRISIQSLLNAVEKPKRHDIFEYFWIHLDIQVNYNSIMFNGTDYAKDIIYFALHKNNHAVLSHITKAGFSMVKNYARGTDHVVGQPSYSKALAIYIDLIPKFNDLNQASISNILSKTIQYHNMGGFYKIFSRLGELSALNKNKLHHSMYFSAAKYGNLDVLEILFSKQISRPNDEELMTNAAQGGHLRVIHFLHLEKHLALTYECFYQAAINNHLRIAEYIYDYMKDFGFDVHQINVSDLVNQLISKTLYIMLEYIVNTLKIDPYTHAFLNTIESKEFIKIFQKRQREMDSLVDKFNKTTLS